MARATRSTTTQEKDKPQDQPQNPRKGAAKKRKRNSHAENEDSPPSKQARTETKEEEGSSELGQYSGDKEHVELPSSGDVPLQDEDAADILSVLEMVDTQGLLDRVFPLPTDSMEAAPSGSPPTPSTSMLSLRTLLQNPAQYPFRLLCVAVQHLHPISSHPRFRPSETASQQLRFCELATSLLNQASRKIAPIPANLDTIITDTEPENPASSTSAHEPPAGVHPRRYALVQRLPTGDWWSSASSVAPTSDGSGKDIKNLHTAEADLVSIFPSPSGAALARKGTLGDYVVKHPSALAHYKPLPPRRVSCGKFLDYGPYASFAPSFDQDGVEVGRIAMGEVIFHQEMKRRLRSLAKGKRRAFLSANEHNPASAIVEDASVGDSAEAGYSSRLADVSKAVESLLPDDEVSAIKTALGTLEMEQAVDELLQRNAKALVRLEELQLTRLRAQGGGSSVVEVGSEEWDVAQGIIDSLALLASLRPRPSNGDPEHAPLIPPASVLHKLQRTLPLQPTEGWYGTLPEGRTTAFHDDTTVHIRAGLAAATKSVPLPAPATPPPKTTATTPAPSYATYTAPYTSSYHPSQYRGYGSYTGQGTTGYYPTTYAASTTTQPAAAPTHYPNAQYAATGHSQYYSGWYSGSSQAAGQPAAQTGMSGNFSSYFAPGSSQQPQRAVANTVSGAKTPSYTSTTWNTTTGGYVAPTLPPHMRTTGTSSASGTPPPTTPTATYGAYYGGAAAPR